MNWNQDIFKEMASVAGHAPSVHNVQPWKLKYTETGFELFQSTSRRLHVGDPKLHDNDVSLGAFIELCSIYLKHQGLDIKLTPYDGDHLTFSNEKIESRFKIVVSPTAPNTDPLFHYIKMRKSFRGIFSKNMPLDLDAIQKINIPGLHIKCITGSEEMKKWAGIYDDSSSNINKQPGYFKELTHWMRFKESDPDFNQDGLNYKALALGKTEASLGAVFFKESVFNLLAELKLEKLLITEAPQIKSAQGIIVIFASKDLSSLEMGRAFVRYWLTLTSLGISVCPLSTLVDFTGSLNILNTLKSSNDIICLNVLRFGKVADEKTIYSSPRLSIERIIIK